ncbi:hypothetical protein DLAC_09157 [Tieghemostelium lacteum]|uniref:Pentacotripeptide-repeat region of PRORP domain-containing protein n=1 Tax=Tieghemostelium lacteum TaxID=361077 RepID=A0A151Z9B3_TIELA|nr:hypothetical protein DLAC_09157 [Tieghemostelium lacteum]|eukprot:KYQ90532.1 hypothetical protein DLAC_09157 [Tieghemostelium lacteum]
MINIFKPFNQKSIKFIISQRTVNSTFLRTFSTLSDNQHRNNNEFILPETQQNNEKTTKSSINTIAKKKLKKSEQKDLKSSSSTTTTTTKDLATTPSNIYKESPIANKDEDGNEQFKRLSKEQSKSLNRIAISRREIEEAETLPDTSSPLSDTTKSVFYDIMMAPKKVSIQGKHKQHLYEFSTESVDPVELFKVIPLTSQNVIKFMQRMGVSNHQNRVLETIKMLDDKGISLDIYLYNTALAALATNADVENSLILFQRLLNEGIKPTTYIFTSLLGVHMRAGKVDEAFHILKSMENTYSLVPDHVNYSTMINGCVINKQYSKAIQLFSEARHKGMEPDSVTLSIMIDACAKDGRVEKAFTYYDEFKYLNLPPTEVTFNSLIHACAKRPDNYYYLKAFELLQEMSLNNYQPDIITYTSLLQAASNRGEISVVEKLYREIIVRKDLFPQKPDQRVFSLVLAGYANNNADEKKTFSKNGLKVNIEKANQILKDTEKFGVKLNSYIMDQYLRVYAYAGKINMAREIFDSYYKEYQLEHTPLTYGILIRMYTTNRRLEKAQELLLQMRQETTFKPDYGIFLSLMHGAAKVGYANTCIKYAKEMTELGFPPKKTDIINFIKRFRQYPEVINELESIAVDNDQDDDFHDRNMLVDK